jgi:hypothetical protein
MASDSGISGYATAAGGMISIGSVVEKIYTEFQFGISQSGAG